MRGTVQADILAEDQGQNTCIFHRIQPQVMTSRVLRPSGVRNLLGVDLGLYIAEAGATDQPAAFAVERFTFVGICTRNAGRRFRRTCRSSF
jgi:methylmalonyl-CoA mutase N-terminal domain/subunit